MPGRKPPRRVVSIKGGHLDDVVTQEQLADLSQLQQAEWIASRLAQKAALEIEARIKEGAVIEHGPLGFDERLRMVRSRKAGGE